MQLTKKDFSAKATQIQIEIASQLQKNVIARGSAHIPDKEVARIFHMAMAYYLETAYNDGMCFAYFKTNRIRDEQQEAADYEISGNTGD